MYLVSCKMLLVTTITDFELYFKDHRDVPTIT